MPWTKVPVDQGELEKAARLTAEGKRNITYRQAIKEALTQALETDRRTFILGEGVDDPGGIFGTTAGLQAKFGKSRVLDIPIAENGMTGVAIGAALAGMKPIMVHQRTDFLLMAMDQLVNHASKWRYMFGGKTGVSLTVRAIIGRGWGSAAQHSQSLQGLFMHVPGLKLVMPSTPYDAKGLLLSRIADGDPVIFIEHRWLYDTVGFVPEEKYLIPLGKGIIRKSGTGITLIGISHMAYEASKAAEILEKEGISPEVIDLRSLKPLDETLLLESVRKTGRLVTADGGWKTCGVGAEISALVAEKAFEYLKAPIIRVSLPDAPAPASSTLEQAYYSDANHIVSEIKKLW